MKRRTTRIVRPSNLGPGRALRLRPRSAVSSRPAKTMMADAVGSDNLVRQFRFGFFRGRTPGRKVSSRCLLAELGLTRLKFRVNLIGATSPDRDDRRQYSVQVLDLE
jgi:hypothetical protein